MAMHRRSTHEDQRHAERVISAEALSSMQLALGRPAPKNHFPEGTIDPDVAAAVIKDELMLDGNARLNLATFVTTWREPQAEALMPECFDKNMIDKDEYPQTAELERRCVSMLADLWNAPGTEGVGCSTTGSSEACMLGALALKRRWQHRRAAADKSTGEPNLILGINAQICWDKFCNFFEVEPRFVPMDGERFHMGAEQAVELCDENTIGVVAILGSTFDGSYEPVAEISVALDALQERTGLDIPIHVDGASGAMIAPFIDPDLKWDFAVPRVASINTSGHKYGKVYPGGGWIIWRGEEGLPHSEDGGAAAIGARADLGEALGGVGDDECRGATACDGHHEVAAFGVQVGGALVHGVQEPAELGECVDAEMGLRAVRRAALETDAGHAEAAQRVARGQVGRLTDEADVRVNVEGGEGRDDRFAAQARVLLVGDQR